MIGTTTGGVTEALKKRRMGKRRIWVEFCTRVVKKTAPAGQKRQREFFAKG